MDTTYTKAPLFLTKEPYQGHEKIAVVTLSRDGDDWEEQISESLHQEHPFIAEHNIQINLTKTDPESGVGVGSIQIDEKVLVPIIIEKFKLAPLDLFWNDDKLHPLTRNSLESVLQDTTMGTPVTPGQGEQSDVSLYSRTQPPFDGKYTYAELADLGGLEQALSDAFTSEEGLRYELRKNATFAAALRPYLEAVHEKVAAAKVEPVKDRITVRTYKPFDKVASHGAYEVATTAGRMPALVFDHVISARCELQPERGMIVGLDKEAAYAYLDPGQEVAGRACSPTTSVPVCDPAPNQRGVFFKMASKGAICTEPLRLTFATEDGWGARDGMNQPVKIVKVAGLKAPIYGDRCLSIPDNWHWIKVASPVNPMPLHAANLTEPHHLENFSIHHYDGRFTVRGLPGFASDGDDYEKTASLLNMRFHDDDVTRVMAAASGDNGDLYLCAKPAEQVKVASAPPIKIDPVNLVKEATFVMSMVGDIHFPVTSKGTIKVAAVTDDAAKQTVDSLLGLNFLNPDNLYRFAEKTTMIGSAKEAVAKLLLASRLGLDVDSRPLRTAMFALDSVERDLRELNNAVEVEEQEG